MRRSVLLMALAIILASCGGLRGGHENTSDKARGGGEAPNWDEPLTDSVSVDSAGEAGLVFSPIEPRLDGPVRMLATSPAHTPPALRSIAWIYDHPSYGKFFITERIVEGVATQKEWDELVAASPGCTTLPPSEQDEKDFGAGAQRVHCSYGNRRFVSMENANGPAILAWGSTVMQLHWLRELSPATMALPGVRANFLYPALEVQVVGPVPELSQDEAIEIGRSV